MVVRRLGRSTCPRASLHAIYTAGVPFRVLIAESARVDNSSRSESVEACIPRNSHGFLSSPLFRTPDSRILATLVGESSSRHGGIFLYSS
jgi:hypothetical protein